MFGYADIARRYQSRRALLLLAQGVCPVMVYALIMTEWSRG